MAKRPDIPGVGVIMVQGDRVMLAAEISRGLSEAESKILHRHPV
ncbi:MAG: hypothetical protein AB7Q37_02625 [Pyrinomonadaceae bacterium]